MPTYLISFPARAMQVPAAEMTAVGEDSRAVIRAAQEAGVYVFAAGIDAAVAPVRIAGDGTVTQGGYPDSQLDGGFTILDLPDRAAAEDWARRIAAACRCDQELRVFMYDPLT